MSSTISYTPQITSLVSEVSSISSVMATMTESADLVATSRSLGYAMAKLSVVSDQQVLATATATSVIESASSAINVASSSLLSISSELNQFGFTPNYAINLIFAIIMGMTFAAHGVLMVFYHTWWFSITHLFATGFELIGYICRFLGSKDTFNNMYNIGQITTLTFAPCFIMAGVYFLLAKLIMIYGEKYAVMKPMRYTQVFLFCDLVSLLLQCGGGGMAAGANDSKGTEMGRNIMVSGLVFQVVSMAVFMGLFIHLLWRVGYFGNVSGSVMRSFNERYTLIRSKTFFRWYPTGVFTVVLLVFVRSVYRVAELSEGWRGYLVVHEVYFLIFDGLMIVIACVLTVVFHSGFVFGRGKILIAGSRAYKKMIQAQEMDMDDEEQIKSNSKIGLENLETKWGGDQPGRTLL
ncbi:CYFA0S12e03884g1_1 [Cyberlindnera fabianii]|uniref:Sphingoid long-chain base transporter RSB1 n=2 Tax=Cyberlindnera fabianii TaxID=36022 RepID=A0A061B1F0_CYBFA|nr:CYFA0S12e03884g1_1 [Cyberlindnera fabianii]